LTTNNQYYILYSSTKEISAMIKVKNLNKGDVVRFNNKIDVVVREKLDNKVIVQKQSAQGLHGVFSISFFSDKFYDCENRVKLSTTV